MEIFSLNKMKRLEAHGWKVESAEEFLSLPDEEKVVMTHAERQKYLKTSGLGEIFGVAHLLPEVKKMSKLIRWSRNSKESLFLEVLEGDIWVHYKKAKFRVSDAELSSKSGFATAQKYLSLGYQYVPCQPIK